MPGKPHNSQQVDIAIVGGGLAGGLIALAVHRAVPNQRIALIEQGKVLGGNHRWSWFASDLSEPAQKLLESFNITCWDAGYDVRFPDHARTLTTGYRSLISQDFASELTRILPEQTIRLSTAADQLSADGVMLDNGDQIEARLVIDCRPFEPSEHLEGGWQVFHGQRLKLSADHDLQRPIIMDADVEQNAPSGNAGAYRFFYSLPLGPDEIFIEDTYYADEPRLDRDLLAARIGAYAKDEGWQPGAILDDEIGVLPVVTGGDFGAYQDSIRVPGVAVAGARGGFSHPLTSYTVPIAVDNALAIAAKIASNDHLTSAQLARFTERRARSHWRASRFHRMLGRMLFGAAEPEKRVDIFALFYRRPQDLVERFYRVQTSLWDRARILTGKPPVSIPSAIGAIFSRGNPLASSKSKPADNGETA